MHKEMSNDLYGSDNVSISAVLEPRIGCWKGELSESVQVYVIELSNREGAESTFSKNSSLLPSLVPFYPITLLVFFVALITIRISFVYICLPFWASL